MGLRATIWMASTRSEKSLEPLPSIPMQQVFVTEVRDEKLGISSQCSPQERTVSLRRDVSGAQPLLQCATIVAPGLLMMISVPFRRWALVGVLLSQTDTSADTYESLLFVFLIHD